MIPSRHPTNGKPLIAIKYSGRYDPPRFSDTPGWNKLGAQPFPTPAHLIDRRDRPVVSVGANVRVISNPVLKSTGVPQMVQKATLGPAIKILGKVVTRSAPQVSPTIPGPAKSIIDPWLISRKLLTRVLPTGGNSGPSTGPNIIPRILDTTKRVYSVPQVPTPTREEWERGRAGATPLPTPAIPPTSLQPRNDMASFDLGNILTTLGGSYINARYGQPQPVAYTQPVAPYYGLAPTPVVGGTNPLIPDFLEGAMGACPPPGYRYNSQGCLVKKRRRRKRLATTSDIKDLAALKQVLGGGQDLKTWIATH